MEDRLRPNWFDREAGALRIVDQTLLPGEVQYRELKTAEEVWTAIRILQVRGAPAIGVAAAYGACLGAREKNPQSPQELEKVLGETCAYLKTSRPTAVNLAWALSRMEKCLAACPHEWDVSARLDALLQEADSILQEDEEQNLCIARHGLSLLQPGMGLLTHCNAGELATSRWGTALGPILLGQQEGYGFHVYADETRPLLQGGRLTAFELCRAGVDVTLQCDNMAASLMAAGKVQAVLVGCDRVARNGDTANKIGTLSLAILARHYGIPFYVLGPTSTVDLSCESGKDIPIEERPGEEITSLWYRQPMAPQGVKTYNPAFDVTPAPLISAIITEKGVAQAPFTDSLTAMVQG
ncbi:S-methyl-5-thioribose-1-phosphate isomerase [Intestinimonas sp. MSJ-38]|uniref:S-methyl-5-thioribose-1-phosphate isomerase n=1 Tax=Intestinimonas sp. MSJ-38 TaxID=2841532 RepID=UPI001C10CD4D|nr:S-methyl-5-thioribose-1-phosphate isomerase [Intestinimonas sp. MSJ-38]MBU5431124.1 S-methyl-5-thioribose-1-phosphate isomerase [Intestinimonas sp. MSJ-38]